MFFFNYSTFVDPLLRDIRAAVPKFAGVKPGEKVLDVCCGTGDQVFYYEKAGAKAYGIDLDQNMINMAKKDGRNKTAKNVSFQVADATKLPFGDDVFDYVSISFALHEKEKEVRSKTISEMKRVVKKQGFLIFIDYLSPLPNNIPTHIIKFIERLAGRRHFDCFNDYISRGGIDSLLIQNRLKEEKRIFFKGKNVAAIKAKI